LEAWIAVGARSIQHLLQILDVASPTLELVSIALAGGGIWHTHVDLKNLSKLTFFDMKAFSIMMWTRPVYGAWMIPVLESVPPANNVEEVLFWPCSAQDLNDER